MNTQHRQGHSERFVAGFSWVTSRISKRPCPVCSGRVSMDLLAKTGLGKGANGPWIGCGTCSGKLRLSKNRLYTKFWFVLMPVFILSAALVAEVFARYELTNIYREHRGMYEAYVLGFILTILLFVFPFTTAAQRIFKIEVLE